MVLMVSSALSAQDSVSIRLDSIVSKARILETSQMGMMVYDLTADSTIYTYNNRQTLRPASTMKLITAITALDRLGADYQYSTKLVSRDSSLVLVGGMDPLINENDLRMIADSLKAMGIDTIRGGIIADRSMKDKDLYGEGWCWDDDNPELSPLVYHRKDYMMEAFQKVLERAGVTTPLQLPQGGESKVSPRGELEGASFSIEITRSLREVLVPMMKVSNNLYAESIYYHIGLLKGKPSTAKKAKAVEEELLRRMGKGECIHRFADGSGLSLYNYVSPDILVAFLRYAYSNKDIYLELYDALPIAGVDGTLKDRMKDTPAMDNVHAKTGTLSGVSSLAGYCTMKNGHLLAFAIMNQGVMKGAYAKALQDRLCCAMCE